MVLSKSAEKYLSCRDLWVITTYFNPGQDSHRLENYIQFADSLNRAAIQLTTVECAFGENPFDLSPTANVIQVRSKDILWQKERLLNLAVSQLPKEARKVAWIDADILFSNPSWAVDTSALLNEYQTVQLWTDAVRLPEGQHSPSGKEEVLHSIAVELSGDPSKIRKGGMTIHGHTGFAWAACRDLLDRYGLYDTGFAVGVDHFMAHAFWGDFDSPCMQVAMGTGILQDSFLRHSSAIPISWLRRVMPEQVKSRLAPWRHWRRDNEHFRDHFLNWGKAVYSIVQGQVGCTPGTVLHLWHSDKARLAPRQVRRVLHKHAFAPQKDLKIGANGCWEWARDESDLRRWFEDHAPLEHKIES